MLRYLLLLFLLSVLVAPKAHAQVPQIEKDALIALYNATDGDNWTNNTNWLSTDPVDTWYGVNVSSGNVVELHLPSNNLTGSIPAEIGDLSNLGLLDLYSNQLTGQIPSSIGQLTNLGMLFLTYNQISGSIPIEIGDMATLEIMHLTGNQLTGQIPVQLGNLTNLQDLALSQNQFSGPIPSELGLLSNLQLLYLSENALTGTIPTALTSLTSLQVLSLMQNQLSGPIPTEIQQLSALQRLYLSFNQFSGHVPVELGNMTMLIELWLSRNELSGTIPSQLGQLTSLVSLTLDDNMLTGTIPDELGDLTNLETLWLWKNELTGYVPTSFSSLTNLKYLDISDNQLSGVLPSELGDLSLEILSISNNQFSGALPAGFGSLSTLQEVRLQSNELTSIPDLTSNTALGYFPVFDNRLTFEDIEPNIGISGIAYHPQKQVPGPGNLVLDLGDELNLGISVGGSANVYQWVKDGDDIVGEESDNLVIASTTLQDEGTYYLRITNALVPSLTLQSENIVLDVSTTPVSDKAALITLYNSTDGDNWTNNTNWLSAEPLESWYGVEMSGDRVEELYLGSNNLNGSIPLEIGNLTELVLLDMSSNMLTGGIPSAMGALTKLEELNLGGCNLGGTLPPELGDLVNLRLAFLNLNQLSGSIPEELGSLTNLITLTLNNNLLTGPIPESLGSLPQLVILWLRENQLTGTVPSTLGDLSNLVQLDLYKNQLTGNIPASLGSLNNLELLDLAYNSFTGSVPAELGNLENIKTMTLRINQLTGPIPPNLGNLTTLEHLDLTTNHLSGAIPSELESLTNLKYLSLQGNELTGQIPSSIGDLSNLIGIGLSNNLLSGPVPSSFQNLVNLDNILIDHNNISSLPDLTNLNNLNTLNAVNNQLDFDDVELNMGVSGFTYTPQLVRQGPELILVHEGGELNITIPVGGSANQYQWKKDGVDIPGEESDNLIIPSIDFSDAGIYSLQITSTLVTDLTLDIVNINVTVTSPPKSYYWVENAGEWSDLNHWATESGGAVKHTGLPTIFDNVYFDENSFSLTDQVVEIADDGDSYGADFFNMDWTGVTNIPEFRVIANRALNSGATGSTYLSNSIGGSLIFSENMTLNFEGCDLYFAGFEDYTIDTKGLDLGPLSFISINENPFSPIGNGLGEGSLASDLDTEYLYIWRRQFTTNGHNIKAYSVLGFSSDFKQVDISNSMIETSFWTMDAISDFNSLNSQIIIVDQDFGVQFNGFGLSYDQVINASDELIIRGSNQFNSLELMPGQTIRFEAGTTQIIDDLVANGIPGNLILIKSDSPGSEAFISKNSGTITVDWVDLEDNHATGGAEFNVTHGTNLGNVDGWNFTCGLQYSLVISEESCEGASDAAISVNPAVNSGILEYSINGVDYQTGNSFANLAPDTYNLTVKDEFGCLEIMEITIDPAVDGTWYADLDEDGYGDPADFVVSCTQPVGYVANNHDCDPADAEINPEAEDVAGSGVDMNCDLEYLWFIDEDGDGYAGESTASSFNQIPGAGEYAVVTDCDDGDPAVSPETAWYEDQDGDGFGDPANAKSECVQPSGYVSNNLDCDPWDPDVYPEAPSKADGKDNNCDGGIDKLPQILTISPIDDIKDDGTELNLNGLATSDAGLEVTYVVQGPAEINEEVLTFSGVGKITVTATQGGSDGFLAADPVAVMFCVNPNPIISMEGSSNEFTLTSNYTSGNQWYFNSVLISGAEESAYQADGTGSYAVTVEVDGCVGESPFVDIVLTSLETLDDDNFIFYPIPMGEILTITTDGTSEGYLIRIVDISGKEWIRKAIEGSSFHTEFDVSQLDPGVYTAIVQEGSRWYVRKLVKR